MRVFPGWGTMSGVSREIDTSPSGPARILFGEMLESNDHDRLMPMDSIEAFFVGRNDARHRDMLFELFGQGWIERAEDGIAFAGLR